MTGLSPDLPRCVREISHLTVRPDCVDSRAEFKNAATDFIGENFDPGRLRFYRIVHSVRLPQKECFRPSV